MTEWLDEDEAKAWRAFIETKFELAGALDRDLADHDMNLGDYQVLVYLSEAESGAMRMRDLAEVLQLSPSGLTRRLDGLVGCGHVERLPSTEDRRVMNAVITDAGRSRLRAVAPHHVASVRRLIFDRLTHDQVCAMSTIFSAIADGLAEERSGDTARAAVRS